MPLTKPLLISVFVCHALLLASSAAAAETAYGSYGKETALTLVREHAGRLAGDPKEAVAAQYMLERMRVAGRAEPQAQEFGFTARRGTLAGSRITSRNIVVNQAGSGNTGRVLIVGAHYDSAPSDRRLDRSRLEGLDDNASGAGVLTELVRHLGGIETEHDIRFVAFGAEEYGLIGSRHFAAQLTAEEKQKALGMINLDSLVTGDKMYVNAGDRAHDSVSGQSVAAYSGLREHALAVAKELGIDLHVNPGDKNVPGTNTPYKPYGVGCCSDQEAFDAAGLPVAGFEATNWDLGPDFDGYTQTDNPKIPGGSTWHDPAEDNEAFLGNALPPGRLEQRMRDFSRLATRLIVEQTNADLLQSVKSAAVTQNAFNRHLHDSAVQAQLPVYRRAAVLQAGWGGEEAARVWLDGDYRYRDADYAVSGSHIHAGVYGEYAVRPQWALGGGLRVAHHLGGSGSIGKERAYGLQAYSVFGAPEQGWSNITVLGWFRHSADLERHIRLGGGNVPTIIDKREMGRARGSVFSLSNTLAYHFGQADVLRHGPYWGVNYRYATINAHRSGDAGSRTALDIGKTRDEQWDSELGYQLQYRFHAGNKPVSLYGQLAYVRLFGQPGLENVTAISRADGRARNGQYQADEDKSYGRLQIGAASQLTPKLSAYVHGDTTLARRERRSAMHLGVQYRF
ncbi:M28 family peptidase [Neisseria shayeganii]|uniref:M28 family peptidase n=1 Tax=Neisseria shayeganii TaxID=607712 RepID=A0A7D7N587_9NEIS|nr:M28 family peptidase [Neisseria shayeganii]QMT39863.1 M28 family peptidase [Neisseria shayeganii]